MRATFTIDAHAGREKLFSLHFSQGSESAPVRIFWPGRTDVDRLARFFGSHAPAVKSALPNRLKFEITGHGYVRSLLGLRRLNQPETPDLRFCIFTEVASAFKVVGRIEPFENEHHNLIAVGFQPKHFSQLATSISHFISETREAYCERQKILNEMRFMERLLAPTA